MKVSNFKLLKVEKIGGYYSYFATVDIKLHWWSKVKTVEICKITNYSYSWYIADTGELLDNTRIEMLIRIYVAKHGSLEPYANVD